MTLEELRNTLKRLDKMMAQKVEEDPAFEEWYDAFDDFGEALIQMHNKIDRLQSLVYKLQKALHIKP